MHEKYNSVDFNPYTQFGITVIAVIFGLIYLVKSTAAKYFVVDDSCSDSHSSDSAVSNSMLCVVCGSLTTKYCARCKVVRYCSASCQKSHWFNGHKDKCEEYRLSCKSSLQGRRNSNAVADSKTDSSVLGDNGDCGNEYTVAIEKATLPVEDISTENDNKTNIPVSIQKIRNFRKYKAEVRENNSLRQHVEIQQKRIAELKENNKALAPILPPGTIPVSQVKWERMVGALKKLEKDVNAANDLRHQKEKEWALERASLNTSIQSINETNRSLNQQKAKLTDDLFWLVKDGIKEFVGKLHDSSEFLAPYGEVCALASTSGFVDGVKVGYRFSKMKMPMSSIPPFDADAERKYDEAMARFSNLNFPYLESISASAVSL